MKKLVLIVSLVFVAASCQKENIVPNAPAAQDRTLKSGTAADPNDGNHGGPIQTISNGTDGSTTDPNNPGDDGGSITDPMKKKDKKDSK